MNMNKHTISKVMAEMGRQGGIKGGKKGGKARMAQLTPYQRQLLAQKAAAASVKARRAKKKAGK